MNGTDYCHYFVKRKKRYCRMTVKKGKNYCGEHQQHVIDAEPNGDLVQDKRVECPLDPTHTCYRSKLSKHLAICNAKKLIDTRPAYIVKGINLETVSVNPLHTSLSRLDQRAIDAVINKVNAAYEKLPQFREAILQHEVLITKLRDECGKIVRKHLVQNASLLAHLDSTGLIKDDTCFIEFGAGKGKLTYWLGQIIKERKDSCILLVDRSSHRHKSDNKLKNEQFPLEIKRIKADIADLKLNSVADIEKFRHKVAIAKHLCGSATDFTLKCLTNAMQSEPKLNVTGLVIAFCCHHRCVYSSYVGKQYLEECGFTADEFPILCSIASWATCGSALSKTTVAQHDHDPADTRGEERTQDSDQREFIGRKVKILLNWGRVKFLQTAGFQSDLVYYTTPDISLENMCIIATKTSTQ